MKKTIFIIVFIIVLAFASLAYADRGVFPIMDADVYGPGQKAIIAWNGEIERLILSTDLYSNREVKVLEVIPFPSKPKVEAGSFSAFEVIQNLMKEKAPRAPIEKTMLEIVFHEKIGVHDVTIVKAENKEELINFMFNYISEFNVPQSLFTRGETVLEDYLNRGFHYWVFDLIDLNLEARSIEPLVYEFQSSFLYYPMKISSLAEGSTKITLYLITSEPINEDDLPAKMSLAKYFPINQPIQFQLSKEELSRIDVGCFNLFASLNNEFQAWLTVIKYEGELNNLDFDLEIFKSQLQCRLIKVAVDKNQYKLRETVNITVNFTHLTPGCFEIQVLHFHLINLEVYDSAGKLIQSWSWKVNEDFYKVVFWKPDKSGNYTIKAASFWNGEKLEVEDQLNITVLDLSEPGLKLQMNLYAGITFIVGMLIGFGVAYLFFKRKKKEETKKLNKAFNAILTFSL
ncbi:DUF2330 domain-containing protein [Candidatus Bathyarchaeota archaeon]|nr:DUF2330 domain-containing protein [Candidatus Bathyarchaeota archaeon]